MILIWALILVGSAVIGNSGNSNNGEETTEQHEARVRRELAEASAIQDRRINIPEYPSMSQLVEIMEAGKHIVMAPYLKNDIDQLSNTINTMYDYVIKNGISSTTGKLKRKKSSGSSSNVRRKSLPRAAKNKLTQIQVVLDEREHQESQQQVL